MALRAAQRSDNIAAKVSLMLGLMLCPIKDVATDVAVAAAAAAADVDIMPGLPHLRVVFVICLMSCVPPC